MTRTLVVVLITLGNPGQLTGGYLYHRRIADRASLHDARLEFVSFPKLPFPLATLAAPRVLQQARRVGADVLVLDSIAAAFLGPRLALAPAPLPLVAMLHQPPGGIDFGPLRSRIQQRLDNLAYRRASLLMVASDALAEQLANAGLQSGRLRVVPPGRDVAAAAGPPPGDLRQGRRAALLCVGNWVARKGIDSLLEALSRLSDEVATLHLVGDDQSEPRYAERLRRRLASADLCARVVAHGPLPLGTVAALYEAADVFVLPSLKEPYGTVYGEAMAAGLPVVGWRAGNLPYLATHQVEGLILEPGDIAGLARAIERLAMDEPLRRKMGEAGRRRAQARPTWDESAGLFYGAIRQALG